MPGQLMPEQPPLDTLETRLIRIEALAEDIKEILTEVSQILKASRQ